MKTLFLVILLLISVYGRTQFLVQLQLPPVGIVEKTQLWRMTLTNTGSTPLHIQVELTFTDVRSGQQVMSATTQVFVVNPGVKQISSAQLSPIQYNILSSAFAIDAMQTGPLPVGEFQVCYNFYKLAHEYLEKIGEDCRTLSIEPLSPPLLQYPYNGTAIAEKNPQFSWLPPTSLSLFATLSYDLDLVEVYPNQTASEAVQHNYPLFRQQNITSTTLFYPVHAPSLEINKQYSWRITARSAQSPVASSEVWQFSLKNFQKADSSMYGSLPYIKLQKELDAGYAIFSGVIKLDYTNETADSVWNLVAYDLSDIARKTIVVDMDSIPLFRGQNLVQIPVYNHSAFINKHIYLLEVTNSRGEIWRLKFQYYKPEETQF